MTDWVGVQRAAQGLASPCSVEGFGSQTNRVASSPAHTYIPVTSTADSGSGTLRSALAQAASGVRLITFDLTGPNQTILLTSGALKIPANTVIDGLGSRVTIDGRNVTGNGVLRVYNSNVAIRHVRVRNAGVNGGNGTDGIQVAPKDATPNLIEHIAIHRVSVTKSIDGGIDTTGCVGLPMVTGCEAQGSTRNVTLAENFLSANGTTGPMGGGGANLTKYGITKVTMVGNFWEKNKSRNPLVDNIASPSQISLADVRHNLVRSPLNNWVQVTGTGANVNVVNGCFEGSSNGMVIVDLSSGGAVYLSGNSFPPGYTPVNGTPSASEFGGAPCLSSTNRDTVFSQAGAVPRDAVDLCFINAADYNQALLCP